MGNIELKIFSIFNTPENLKTNINNILIASCLLYTSLATGTSGADFNLTKRQIYIALAKTLPINGKLVPNPTKTWYDVDHNLPNVPINVMGPPPTSGTRDAFLEIVMEAGARTIATMDNIRSNDENRFKAISHAIREDGAWKDAGENDNLIVQALSRNPSMLGIFGFSFYEENMDKVQACLLYTSRCV